jgi:hypothetical protein
MALKGVPPPSVFPLTFRAGLGWAIIGLLLVALGTRLFEDGRPGFAKPAARPAPAAPHTAANPQASAGPTRG